jgi:hypothetical protein
MSDAPILLLGTQDISSDTADQVGSAKLHFTLFLLFCRHVIINFPIGKFK